MSLRGLICIAVLFASNLACGALPTVEWRTLSGLTFSKLKEKFHGKRVRIMGHMIPLEGDEEFVTEFIFARSMPICPHYPPPPPVMRVKVKKSDEVLFSFVPFWIEGTLYVEKEKTTTGESYIQLKKPKVIQE